jgi:membrane-associated phospholipid phosphatase
MMTHSSIQISAIRRVITNQTKIVHLFAVLFFFLPIHSFGQSTYKLSVSRDVPLSVGGAGLIGTSFILKAKKEVLTPEHIDALNRADINRFDRSAAYNWYPAAAHASDAGMYLSMAVPSLIFINEKARTEYKAVMLMTVETYLITAGLTSLTKELVKRERPFTYNPNAPLDKKMKKDARSSFFSGHTSLSASGTFLTAKMYADFNPESRWKPMVWTGAALLPALTGFLRYQAGKHFWTDILTGYIVGAAVGVAVPAIHKARAK